MENEKGNMPGQEYNIGKDHWKMENRNMPGQDSPLKKGEYNIGKGHWYHRWKGRMTKEIWVKTQKNKNKRKEIHL